MIVELEAIGSAVLLGDLLRRAGSKCACACELPKRVSESCRQMRQSRTAPNGRTDGDDGRASAGNGDNLDELREAIEVSADSAHHAEAKRWCATQSETYWRGPGQDPSNRRGERSYCCAARSLW